MKKINMASVSGNPIEVFLGERIDPANYWMFLVSDLDKIHGISKVSFFKEAFFSKIISFFNTLHFVIEMIGFGSNQL